MSWVEFRYGYKVDLDRSSGKKGGPEKGISPGGGIRKGSDVVVLIKEIPHSGR